MKPAIATFFSGFGLFYRGAIDAGYESVFACEWNGNPKIGKEDAIASVYADSLGGDHMHCMPIQCLSETLLRSLEGVDMAQFSPPCTSYSVSNTTGEESPLDLELAAASARAIRLMRPVVVVVENVWGYANPKNKSLPIITDELARVGYAYDYWHLNSADYGTPQQRRRLILIARRDGVKPLMPRPTHDESPRECTMSLFDAPLLPWNGWYDAIADLLGDCPESDLAHWQEGRMRKKYGDDWRERFADGSLLVGGGSVGRELQAARSRRPAVTAKANNHKAPMRAVIVEGDAAGDRCPALLTPGEPAMTIKTGGGVRLHRALLFSDHQGHSSGGEGRCVGEGHASTPAQTIRAKATGGGDIRALLLLPSGEDYRPRPPEEPTDTIRSQKQGDHRAMLVGMTDTIRDITVRTGEEPSFTVKASAMRRPSSVPFTVTAPNIRIVSLTPRCLARFQDLPDTYRLPEKKGLACTGIGNGVPCLLAKAICESVKG